MGQLYYAQTQLYSIVLEVKFSGQYELNIAIHYSLLGVHLFRLFSQIIYQGPNKGLWRPKPADLHAWVAWVLRATGAQ